MVYQNWQMRGMSRDRHDRILSRSQAIFYLWWLKLSHLALLPGIQIFIIKPQLDRFTICLCQNSDRFSLVLFTEGLCWNKGTQEGHSRSPCCLGTPTKRIFTFQTNSSYINHCEGCQSFKCFPSLILNLKSSTWLPVERPVARIRRCRRRRRWGSRGGRRGGWGCTGGWRGRTLGLPPLRAGPRQLHCDNVFAHGSLSIFTLLVGRSVGWSVGWLHH